MAFNRYVLIEQLKGINKQCSVAEFAAAIGYTERQVSRWMSGESKPSASVVERMAEWFGLPIEAFTTSGELTPEEYDLIDAYRRLSRTDRARVMVYVADLVNGAATAASAAASSVEDPQRPPPHPPTARRKTKGTS